MSEIDKYASDIAADLARAATALERIADLLERATGKTDSGRSFIRTFDVGREN